MDLLFPFGFLFLASALDPFRYDVEKVVGQHEGNAFASNAKFALEIAEKVSEVDVQELEKRTLESKRWKTHRAYLACPFDHDVIAMPITDTENVRGNAIAGARHGEIPHSILQFPIRRHTCTQYTKIRPSARVQFRVVVRFEPVEESPVVESASSTSLRLVYLRQRLGVNDFDEADAVSSRKATVHGHPKNRNVNRVRTCTNTYVLSLEIETVLLPQTIHEVKHLQGQHVLSQIYVHDEDEYAGFFDRRERD